MILLRSLLKAEDLTLLAKYQDVGGYEPGRQGTGYEKLSLLQFEDTVPLRQLCLDVLHGYRNPAKQGDKPIREHDAYLLRYAAGSSIPKHLDPLKDRDHRRLNVLVVAPEAGGELRVRDVAYPLAPGDAYIFRPDREEHEVTTIEKGSRCVFSVGIGQ